MLNIVRAVLTAISFLCLFAVRADPYSTGVLTDSNLVAQTEHKMLLARIKSDTGFREFMSFWEPVLKKSGRVNIRHSYVDGTVSVKYDSPDNLAVRSFAFDADVLRGNIVENVRRLCSSLEESGMRVAGAFAVEAGSGTAPSSGVIYYLTPIEDVADREIRLRYLKFPDPEVTIKGDLLLKAGVRIAIREESGAIFYIGKRLGIYVLKAGSVQKAAAQAAYYREFVRNNKETFLGVETDILDGGDDVYKYITKVFTYISADALK